MIIGKHYESERLIGIELTDGRISQMIALDDQAAFQEEDMPYIAPGLVDLQINGYKGEDFNQLPLSLDSIHRFVKLMWSRGVTSCYPTLITNGFAQIKEALTVIAAACQADERVHATIAGVHLEGPFISPKDGARGAHDAAFVCAPNIEWLNEWQAAAGGRIKIVTLSPEWEESSDFIRYAASIGITVSIGHTSATPEQIHAAVEAGVRMVTHFGNGVHVQLPRHPNYLWEQLSQDALSLCVIADGHHLPKQVLDVVYKLKKDKMILVSDAVALSGSAPGVYETFVGGQVVLTESGRLHLASSDQLLAGSIAMLDEGVRKLAEIGVAGFAEAWNMASLSPSSLMGMPSQQGISIGAPADLVLFNRVEELEIRRCYKGGRLVFEDME